MMRDIDCFNHYLPSAPWERLAALPGKDIAKRMRGVPAIYDLNPRRST